MRLCFDSIEEVKEFVASLKGTRGGKKGEADEATPPAPLAPPTGGQPNAPAFNPGATHAPAIDPVVKGLVDRIVPRIDAAIASGQPAENVLTWFRQQCGAEAVNYDLNQIKTIALPKQSVPTLEGIAKLMAA